MAAVLVIQSVAIVLLGVLVVGLLRSHAEILRTLHELGAGLDPDTAASGTTTAVPAPVRRTAATGFDVSGATPSDETVRIGAHDRIRRRTELEQRPLQLLDAGACRA